LNFPVNEPIFWNTTEERDRAKKNQARGHPSRCLQEITGNEADSLPFYAPLFPVNGELATALQKKKQPPGCVASNEIPPGSVEFTYSYLVAGPRRSQVNWEQMLRERAGILVSPSCEAKALDRIGISLYARLRLFSFLVRWLPVKDPPHLSRMFGVSY
jgi:hypothetical protein